MSLDYWEKTSGGHRRAKTARKGVQLAKACPGIRVWGLALLTQPGKGEKGAEACSGIWGTGIDAELCSDSRVRGGKNRGVLRQPGMEVRHRGVLRHLWRAKQDAEVHSGSKEREESSGALSGSPETETEKSTELCPEG